MYRSEPVSTGVSRFAAALAEACVLAALIVTPVYFNPETQRVFEPDKLAWVFLLGLGALWAQVLASAETGRAGWRRPSRRNARPEAKGAHRINPSTPARSAAAASARVAPRRIPAVTIRLAPLLARTNATASVTLSTHARTRPAS